MSRDWQAGYVNMGGSDAHSGRPMSEPLRETGNQSRESIMLPGKRQWPFSTISLGHQVIGVNTKNIWRWKNPNIRLYLLALQDLNTIIRKDREIEREEGTRSDFINSKLLCSSRENDVYSLNDEFRRGNVLISRMASVWFIQKWLSYFGSNQLMIILNLKKKNDQRRSYKSFDSVQSTAKLCCRFLWRSESGKEKFPHWRIASVVSTDQSRSQRRQFPPRRCWPYQRAEAAGRFLNSHGRHIPVIFITGALIFRSQSDIKDWIHSNKEKSIRWCRFGDEFKHVIATEIWRISEHIDILHLLHII